MEVLRIGNNTKFSELSFSVNEDMLLPRFFILILVTFKFLSGGTGNK